MLPRLRIVTLILLLVLPGLAAAPAAAQTDGLPLPADLFVLTEAGAVMRLRAGEGFAAAVGPTDQAVVDFTVSPDGAWIAYRTAATDQNAAFLAITAVENQSGQVLEFETAGQPPLTGRGQTIAWSPDAAAIAYTTAEGLRVYLAGVGDSGGPAFQNHTGGPFLNLVWSPGGGFLAAEAESNVWYVYRRETGALAYAGQIPGSAGIAWVSEGVLALAPSTGGLLLLDVRAGTQSALLDAATIISQPTVINGERLVFLVHEASGQRFAARRFGTVSIGGGDYQEFEAALELTAAMRWLPDGAALLAADEGTLTLIEPRTDTRRELMSGVKAYTWGPLPPAEVAGLALPNALYFLSEDDAGVAQVWRLPADGSPAAQITAEPANVLDFALSPDGAQIAFTSGGSLIVANRDGTAGRELSPVSARPGALAQPAWSPDGQFIAFVRDGIWIVPAIGGARTELITDVLAQDTPPGDVRVYMNPRWSPGGSLLLVDIGYYEGAGVGVLPITGGEALAFNAPHAGAAWLPNGQVITWGRGFGFTLPGLNLFDPADVNTPTAVLGENWSILDAVPLANEAAAVLRSPSADAIGPSIAQPYLVPLLPDALPIPNGQGALLEAPTLSPDGAYAAGLREAAYNDFGLAGRLVIINLESGERAAVTTPGAVWNLQWGVGD